MSSLVDALLLDPWRDPREIWLARRADSQRGSGTISDPYDGGTREGAGFALSLEKISDFTVQATATGHGLLDWDVVHITGATDTAYNGEFWKTVVDDDTFEYRSNAALQSSMDSATARKVIYLFDEVMRTAPQASCVHLGPGVFETRGFVPRTLAQSLTQGWAARPGQRIAGAGIGATTLRLMHASSATHLTMAIAHDHFSPPGITSVDEFDASDFTVDCNMRAQPRDVVAKAAVLVHGRHIRLRRLRAVDFGTHIPGIECFTFTTAGGHPDLPERVDCRIEDCVLEQPGLNGLYANTAVHLASTEEPTGGRMGWHRGCALRDNYVNCEYVDAPVSIASISLSGGVATATTRAAHGRQAGDWVVISGARVSGSADTTFNGSHKVITRVSDTQFNYEPDPAPAANPTGDMWLGRFSSQWVPVAGLVRDSADPTIAKLTTSTPHNRRPGQWVNVIPTFEPNSAIAPYFGRFPVIEDGTYPLTPKELYYQMESAAGANVPANPADPLVAMFLGAIQQGLSADGGSEAVAEGNSVFHCRFGGPYHDTWGTKDFVARDNYFSHVISGPYQLMGRNGELRPGVLTVNNGIATFTADTGPHGLVKGQAVLIRRAAAGGGDDVDVGFFAIDSTPTTYSFTFAVSGPIPGTGFKFAVLWQVGNAIIEHNIIELEDGRHPNGYGYSSAIPFVGRPISTQFVFRKVLLREKILRTLPEPPNPAAYAIELGNTENAIVDRNIIDLPKADPIGISNSKPLHLFANQTLGGSLFKAVAGRGDDELASRIEDSIVMALL